MELKIRTISKNNPSVSFAASSLYTREPSCVTSFFDSLKNTRTRVESVFCFSNSSKKDVYDAAAVGASIARPRNTAGSNRRTANGRPYRCRLAASVKKRRISTAPASVRTGEDCRRQGVFSPLLPYIFSGAVTPMMFRDTAMTRRTQSASSRRAACTSLSAPLMRQTV